MDTRPPPIDDTTLHAWVDGQLPPDEAERVARALVEQPDAAAQVAVWQAQRRGLQALHAGLLDEPVPPRLLAALRPPEAPAAAPDKVVTLPARRAWASAWSTGLAASVVLAAGIGLGWTARGWQPGADLSVPRVAVQAVPAFVRDAGAAHVLYVPEQRHPVEVGAEQQQHLVQWLSKRLGQPLRVPVLVEQGWTLVGGRLLPAGETEPGAGSLARAQFMYEGSGGARLTLYVAVTGDANGADRATTAFRYGAAAGATAGQAAPRSLYWVDGPLGYALTGTLSAETLTTLARQVHLQLGG